MDVNYRKTRKTHDRGTRAVQPAANDVLSGTLYFVTDEGVIERSNGTIWESFSASAASPVIIPSLGLGLINNFEEPEIPIFIKGPSEAGLVLKDWTPVIGGDGGESGQTYSIQVGKSSKEGPKVTITFTVQLSVKGTITGNVVIKNIPYPIITLTNYNAVGIIEWGQLNTSWSTVALIAVSGDNKLFLQGATAAGTSSLAASLVTGDLTNTSIFRGTAIYFTDA